MLRITGSLDHGPPSSRTERVPETICPSASKILPDSTPVSTAAFHTEVAGS